MRIASRVRRPGAVTMVGLLALVLAACGSSGQHQTTSSTPNILFVIMDDVGIDQMQVFGYGGDTPPSMPNIDQLAHAGIRKLTAKLSGRSRSNRSSVSLDEG